MKKLLIKIYIVLQDVYKLLWNDFWLKLNKKPIVKSDLETIQKIVSEKCSICRYGDGEFSLIMGENLKFQDYSPAIARELADILIADLDNKNMLVCIPDIFENINKFALAPKKYWKHYLHNKRNRIYKLIRFDKEYYDAQITRFYIDYADKRNIKQKVAMLKKIWDDKRLLIVEGEKSRLGMGNNLFDNARDIKRVVCPSRNAYERIDDIVKCVNELESQYDLILLALGPTATVLAYRLANRKRQVLDIGHIDIEYEWYLKGIIEKEPVEHKYIGEMPGGDIVDDIVDEQYISQIVAKIL